MPEPSFRVAASTTGTPSPGYEHLSGGYRWRKHHDWFPGNPDYADPPAGPVPGRGREQTAERAARIAEFVGYRDQGLTVAQAGKLLGVSPKTAREYEKARAS